MNTYCYHLICLNTCLSIFIYLNKTTLSKLNMIKSQTVNFLLNVLIPQLELLQEQIYLSWKRRLKTNYFSSMLFFIYSILFKNEKNLQYGHCRNKMKNKTNNKLSKHLQNQIIKLWKEANSSLIGPNTQIHDYSLSWVGTGTSKKRYRVKLVLWTQTSPLSEMMRSGKCFPHVSKMATLTVTYNQANRNYY